MKKLYILNNIIIPILSLFFLAFLLGSCKKQQEWLEIKPNLNNITPERINEFQALLDYEFNYTSKGTLTVISAAPFSLTDAEFNAIEVGFIRNTYTWNKQIYEGRSTTDWGSNYSLIAIANICLEGIAKIPVTQLNQNAYNQVKGTALFLRANSYLNLLEAFSKPYNANTADKDLGIVLKLTSSLDEKIERASVKKCYNQIISDLNEAVKLLPEQTTVQIRPTSTAAKALLARTYLLLENWNLAAQMAAEALSVNSFLIDFNTISTTATIPFPSLQNKNPEVIFYTEMTSALEYGSNGSFIDSTLYQSYNNNDLRRLIFYRLFNNRPIFKGYYTGRTITPFGGIATNELYLIRAEALARLNDHSNAISVLNSLLIKRWRTGTFVPLTANNAEDALSKIITERRKELPFTGHLPWMDLRRLNKDNRFARTLKRTIMGKEYILLPNSPNYVLPIPDEEIRFSGIPQNERQ